MNRHIVEYEKYCNKCLYSNKPDTEDPCDECLNNPINEDTRRPVNFKEDPNAKDSKKTTRRTDRRDG